MNSLKQMLLLVLLISSFVDPNATRAATLIGGVTVNDSLPQAQIPLKPMAEAKYDKTAPAPTCDCIGFDQNRVSIKLIDGNYKIVDADHWILDFANSPENAKQAFETIKAYQMNSICFAGRNSGKPMMYFLSNGQAPAGALKNEDAIPFDSTFVKAEQINGSWKLTCGNMWMEDFGAGTLAEKAAYDAAAQIRYFSFSRQCFVGRPGAAMTYYAK